MKLRQLLSTSAVSIALIALTPWQAIAQTSPDSSDGSETKTLEAFSAWRDIEAFSGEWKNIDPFSAWRDIEAFSAWRDIEAFRAWRDIEAFSAWRDIEAFGAWRDIEAFSAWRDIEAFGDGLNAFWGGLGTQWQQIAGSDDNAVKLDLLKDIIADSEAFWGEAVNEQTGLSFSDGFSDALLAEYGIDLNDPSSLDDFDLADLVYFHFDWHDGLMGFTGMDQVDWWMPVANWNPDLTTAYGGGDNTLVGLIDFSINGFEDLEDNLIKAKGSDDAYKGHGGAVASLIAGAHDGKGVMGIAPQVSVVAYNPFDEEGRASWDTVQKGVKEVSKAGASVVNLSLGIPGATFDSGWSELYQDQEIELLTHHTVFVHAAGNDGVVQTEDVNWGTDIVPPVLIVVGSVGFDSEISSFSNTPGEVCLMQNAVGDCSTQLKDVFVVAPGEFLLVADIDGGVTRASGTSFAAPIVSGAVALMHDRWPWLKQHPKESADLIFKTAKDLGEPGVDAVYGHGLIDIEASQMPLNWDDIYVYQQDGDQLIQTPVDTALESGATHTIWNLEDGYFTVFENIGTTYRDFQVPLEETLVNTVETVVEPVQQLEEAISSNFLLQIETSLISVGWGKSKSKWFTPDFAWTSANGTEMTVQFAALGLNDSADDLLPYRAELMGMTQSGKSFRIGQGDGASRVGFAFGGTEGSANPVTGGANPIMGFASGGAYGQLEMPISEGVSLSFGASERKVEQSYKDPNSQERIKIYEDLADYRSQAVNMALTSRLNDRLAMTVSYTALSESEGLLGMQTLDQSGFGDGSMTHAATAGAMFRAGNDIAITASATYGATSSRDSNAAFAADDISTSAFEIAVAKLGVFSARDAMRLSLVQPMHVENGALNVDSYDVIDRTTGEIGEVQNSFDFTNGDRKLALEARYGARFNDDKTELSAFVRMEGARGDSSVAEMEHMVGGRMAYTF